MVRIATWIRENDEENFARFFRDYADVQVENARLRPVSLQSAAGLLLTGGPDIAAEFHGKPPSDPSLIEDPEPARDAWEFSAVRQGIASGMPTFCVCKGVQVLNLALGGTLHLDIRGHDLPELKSQNLQPLRHDRSATQRFEMVNSSHHQAIDEIADGLEIEAWSKSDEIVEQVRLRAHPFCLGVQYHPERDLLYKPLFEEFLRHVRAAGG